MSGPIRCCRLLAVELDLQPRFSLASLACGGDGLDRSPRWLARAAHLDAAVTVDLDDLRALQAAADGRCARAELEHAHGVERVARLLASGLLLDESTPASQARRDQQLEAIAWWPSAAITHMHGRWHDNDIGARWEAEGGLSSQQMIDAFGAAPDAHPRRGTAPALPLPLPRQRAFDALLAQRMTCRNFDLAASIDQDTLASMLFRMIGTLGTHTFAPGAVAVKKHAPAGGGLHVTEAYVLARRVEGLAVGLYHYCSDSHALETLRRLDDEEARTLGYRALAGQHWFADAPLLVFLTSRFDRLYWKYRRHSKAFKVAQLDAGHISQLMYLSAAELGLGAFVTAAINDGVIEQALELDPVVEGATAIVGFGARAAQVTTRELTELQPSEVMQRIAARDSAPT